MSRQHKIVYVCSEYMGAVPRSGGIGAAVRSEAEWMVGRGMEVYCVCLTANPPAESRNLNGVEVRYLKVSSIPRARAILDRLRVQMQVRKLLNGDPGVVAVPDYGGPLLARPAAAPLIVQSQGSLMLINSQCGKRTSPADAWFERRTYRSADHVQAVSEFAGVETLRLVGCSQKPLTVIPNVLNSPVFFPAAASVQPKSILFATQCLSELKGTLVLAKAMQRVFEDVPGATLVVVGRDTKIGGRSARQQFIERIPEARRPQVSFHDALSQEELAARMRTAGVVVVPSSVESFSLISLEAMGSGRPVVASRRGGLPEVVEDRRTGFLADPDAPDTFAEALRTLLLDPELATQMGQAGFERAHAVYAPDQVYKRTLELHRELLRVRIPVTLEQEDTTSTLRSAQRS